MSERERPCRRRRGPGHAWTNRQATKSAKERQGRAAQQAEGGGRDPPRNCGGARAGRAGRGPLGLPAGAAALGIGI